MSKITKYYQLKKSPDIEKKVHLAINIDLVVRNACVLCSLRRAPGSNKQIFFLFGHVKNPAQTNCFQCKHSTVEDHQSANESILGSTKKYKEIAGCDRPSPWAAVLF